MPTLKTAAEIAKDIATRHGTTCSHTTVWRAAKALSLKPEMTTPGGYQFYSAVQAKKIERHLTGVLKRASEVTFTQLVLAGKEVSSAIDDYVEKWHLLHNPIPLPEFLGFTSDEYARWVQDAGTLDSIIALKRTATPKTTAAR